MQYFDAHCDTVLRVAEAGLDFVAGGEQAHLDLPRLLGGGSSVQLFAICMPRSHFPQADLPALVDQAIATLWDWAEASGGRMSMALTAAHLWHACRYGQFHGLIALEGADCLEGRAENLERLARAGVRDLIPAWDDNVFSGTAFGENRPLSAEGVKLIELAEALRVMVDVSHLSDAAFAQVCDITHRPFIASHSNCRALCPALRNLEDDMIRALAERGGVMGINLAPLFLEPGYLAAWQAIAPPIQAAFRAASDPAEREAVRQQEIAAMAGVPRPGIEWVVRHVQHAIQVGGEDCVGLGGDLDGIEVLPEGMTGFESYPRLVEALLQAGLSEVQVEKVCWKNMLRVFTDVLPD